MIRENEVCYIGRIAKFRGIRGEVELLVTDDTLDRGESEYLVLEMDGILVPFFWEEYRFKNADTAIVKFEGVDTEQAARTLVGHRVFYPLRFLPEPDETEGLGSWQALTGFTVTDENGRTIGTVEQVDDRSTNILLYLLTPDGGEIIIPFHEDFMTDCSLRGRRLSLRLPDGLLNINA